MDKNKRIMRYISAILNVNKAKGRPFNTEAHYAVMSQTKAEFRITFDDIMAITTNRRWMNTIVRPQYPEVDGILNVN